MSVQAADSVLRRSFEDEEFLNRFEANPAEALSQYELTDEEQMAFESRDEEAMLATAGRSQQANYIIVVFP